MKNIPFVKYHTGLSYLFSPAETRFILHMLELEFLKTRGFNTGMSRAMYMQRMALNEYSFDKCVKRLEEMNLLQRKYNRLGNKVYYQFNLSLYEKLITILSSTNNLEKLIQFCDIHFKNGKRAIESITDKEIEELQNSWIIPEKSLEDPEEKLELLPSIPEESLTNSLIPVCEKIIAMSKDLEKMINAPHLENKETPS